MLNDDHLHRMQEKEMSKCLHFARSAELAKHAVSNALQVTNIQKCHKINWLAAQMDIVGSVVEL
jgi:hypothetical protein